MLLRTLFNKGLSVKMTIFLFDKYLIHHRHHHHFVIIIGSWFSFCCHWPWHIESLALALALGPKSLLTSLHGELWTVTTSGWRGRCFMAWHTLQMIVELIACSSCTMTHLVSVTHTACSHCCQHRTFTTMFMMTRTEHSQTYTNFSCDGYDALSSFPGAVTINSTPSSCSSHSYAHQLLRISFLA